MATVHSESVVLDVAKRLPIDRTLLFRRGEAGLATIDATIMDNGTPYNLTGCSVMFYAYNSKLQRIYESARLVTAASGKVSYTVSSSFTSVAGEISLAYFRISSGNNVITTQSIPIVILDDVDLSSEVAGAYENQFEKLLKDIEDLNAQSSGIYEQARTALSNANTAVQNANTAVSTAQTNESSRQSAESTRQSNESARQSAETSRDSAEAKREQAEASRNTAETAREKAEAQRVDEFAQLKGESQSATSDAKSAADTANKAADRVDTAIDIAERAAEKANTAAGRTEEAIANAYAAAGDATSAASASREATNRLNETMDTFDTILASEVTYAVGESATTPPTGGWTASPIATPQGSFLWSRTVTHYLKGSDKIAYSVARQGVDGKDGMTADINGLFWLYTDENNDLWVVYSDENNPPEFEYNEFTGDLYVIYDY